MPPANPTTLPQSADIDPVTLILIVMSAIVVVAVFSAVWERRRGAAYGERLRAWIDRERRRADEQHAQTERLARRVIATSSTGSITGFTIVRQIEAVFTEGHVSPQAAVDALKALAATKGANALINLESQRVGAGKCSARADAVIVEPIGGPLDPARSDGRASDDPGPSSAMPDASATEARRPVEPPGPTEPRA